MYLGLLSQLSEFGKIAKFCVVPVLLINELLTDITKEAVTWKASTPKISLVAWTVKRKTWRRRISWQNCYSTKNEHPSTPNLSMIFLQIRFPIFPFSPSYCTTIFTLPSCSEHNIFFSCEYDNPGGFSLNNF